MNHEGDHDRDHDMIDDMADRYGIDDDSDTPQLPGGSPHDRWMRLALEEARQAVEQDEVPVGAVVVAAGRIVASAHNQREQLADPTAHAEMIALTHIGQGSSVT